jgi:hypothetical protein
VNAPIRQIIRSKPHANNSMPLMDLASVRY